jgi:ABC-type xylose transport system permease subunit
VQNVGSVAFVADWLTWVAIGALGLGVLVGLAGIFLRPERGEGTFALGVFFASTAGSLVVFGYLVPLLVLPAFSDDPWMGVFSRLANHHRNLTLLLSVACLVVAALIVFGTSSRRERRQHSTPLNVGRYRDERSWSR